MKFITFYLYIISELQFYISFNILLDNEVMQTSKRRSFLPLIFIIENLEVLYMSREPAPKGLLELTVCKCKKSGCKRSDLCPCRANEMCCTEACLCMSGDECDNPFKVFLDFSDDEEDS